MNSGLSASYFFSSISRNRSQSACLLFSIGQKRLETRGVLWLIFLHLLAHKEFGHLRNVPNLDGEMYPAGFWRKHLDAIALAKGVVRLGSGSHSQKTILFKLGDEHRLLALKAGKLTGLKVAGSQVGRPGGSDTDFNNARNP